MIRNWWQLDPLYSRMTMRELMVIGTDECMMEVHLRICRSATEEWLLWFIQAKRTFAQMACDELCSRDPTDKVLRQIIRSNPAVAFVPATMLIARRAQADALDEIVMYVPRARRLAWDERCWRYPPKAATINKMWQRFPELSTPG